MRPPKTEVPHATARLGRCGRRLVKPAPGPALKVLGRYPDAPLVSAAGALLRHEDESQD